MYRRFVDWVSRTHEKRRLQRELVSHICTALDHDAYKATNNGVWLGQDEEIEAMPRAVLQPSAPVIRIKFQTYLQLKFNLVWFGYVRTVGESTWDSIRFSWLQSLRIIRHFEIGQLRRADGPVQALLANIVELRSTEALSDLTEWTEGEPQ